MNLQISAENMDLTLNIKEMADKKIGRKIDQLLPSLNDDTKNASLIIKRDKYKQYGATFDMNLPGKNGRIFAHHQHIRLVSVLTGLREQIEKQIKKYKQQQVGYSLG